MKFELEFVAFNLYVTYKVDGNNKYFHQKLLIFYKILKQWLRNDLDRSFHVGP